MHRMVWLGGARALAGGNTGRGGTVRAGGGAMVGGGRVGAAIGRGRSGEARREKQDRQFPMVRLSMVGGKNTIPSP